MIDDTILKKVEHLRNTTKDSYSQIAFDLLGDRSQGTKLRSALRLYQMKQMPKHILQPINKLFDDPLVLSDIPTMIIGDTHCPYQNTNILEQAFELARLLNIKRLIHAGDLIDAGSYNSQSKHEKVSSIQTDILHARSILYVAQNIFKEIVIMPGNHDQYYLKKEKISFSEFIKDHVMENKHTNRIITTEYDYVYYDNFAVIGHPQNYDPTPGILAAKLADKYMGHVLIAHDHIQGCVESSRGHLGISIGMMAMRHRFAYKEKTLTLFPESDVGFAIIKNRDIYLYNDQMIGKKLT